ncbi:MAG: prepilin peptidase [Rhizomicrobium sp.]|jgi:prepilin peptidase CpaA
MIAELLVLLVMPALLATAAGWDLASFTIPNFIQLGMLAVFVLLVFALGMTPGVFATHLLAGFVGLVLGFALFALGYVGGGDAKLFACVALALGLHDLLDYALVATIFGGALTLCLLAGRKLPLPLILAKQKWISRLHDDREGVPYGVALALGAFVILPHTEIFRAAAGI